MIEIIHSGGNCFIGEWNPGTLILKNPRVVQKNPAGGYAMGKIIGDLYAIREGNGEIRRLNVNMAPLEVEGFRRLREARIGTFQAFQETYHQETYRRMHPSGPKADYGWRLHTKDGEAVWNTALRSAPESCRQVAVPR